MKEIYGNFTPDTKFADLHMHTSKSDGKMEPHKLVDLAVELGHLNILAITDHDLLTPALESQRYAESMHYPIQIIAGQEITIASKGHLVGIYLSDEIPKGLQIEETIKAIHKQGGLAIAVHPFSKNLGMRSVGGDQMDSMLDHLDPEIFLDGVEVYNAGLNSVGQTTANQKAQDWYQEKGKSKTAATGGTDGHFYGTGTGLTGYTGDLKEAIKKNSTGVFALEIEEIIEMLKKSRKIFGDVVDVNVSRLLRRAERRRNI